MPAPAAIPIAPITTYAHPARLLPPGVGPLVRGHAKLHPGVLFAAGELLVSWPTRRECTAKARTFGPGAWLLPKEPIAVKARRTATNTLDRC